jgi:ELWxxDGT repeat protein
MKTPLKTDVTSLIIIDSRITDWQSLMGDINPNATILVLDPSRDGLTQIAEAVANSTNIDAIHIISHGNAGSLQLGSTTLDSNNLSNYQAQLESIGNALTSTGDILLYGCDVAQGESGLTLINQLSSLTGADIAASTDLTGNAVLGGDWILEAQTGTIEANSAISLQAQAAYKGTLGGNLALFFANDGVNGVELWATNGITSATHLVKDIAVGANSSSPHSITSLGNGKALFNATDGLNGNELWITDGTTQGTNLVKDIWSGTGGSYPNGFTLISTNNDALTLTSFSTAVATGNEDSEIAISFASLQTQGNEADIDGTVTAFVIKAVNTGSLKIGTDALTATAWSASNNTVDATHQAYWTPSLNANGVLNAFTAVAKDNGGLESSTPIQATVSIAAINDAPILTSFNAVVTGNENSEIAITFANLQAQGYAVDVDGTVTAFVIKAVNTGSLKIGTDALTATAWSASNNSVDASHQAYWTPSLNAKRLYRRG